MIAVADVEKLHGLTWQDVDFNKKTITINKITQYDPLLGIYEKEPKTKSSYRKIVLSDNTMEVLKQLKREQDINKLKLGSKWKNSKRVFQTEEGRRYAPRHTKPNIKISY